MNNFICTYEDENMYAKGKTCEEAFLLLQEIYDQSLTPEDCCFYEVSQRFTGRTSYVFDTVGT